MDKTVCHIGPIRDNGGMASVIESITSMNIPGWTQTTINSYSRESLWGRISLIRTTKKTLTTMFQNGELDVVHVHVTHGFSWFRKSFFFRWCINNKVPLIIHIHSGKPQKIISKTAKLLDEVGNENKVMAVVLEKRWYKEFQGAHNSKVIVIPNAPRAKFRKNSASDKNLKFGIFSRPLKHKRHSLALEALSIVRDRGYNISMVATGSPFDNPPEWVDQRGWVSEDELLTLMSECSFLIQTSTREGSSMAVIEALSMGLTPIVSEASAETTDERGFVVSGSTPLDWASTIIDAILLAQNKKNDEEEPYSGPHDRALVEKSWSSLYDSILHQG